MSPINISIRHNDNFGVSEFFEGELFSTDPCSQCRDDVNDLGISEDFVESCLVYIDTFTFKREDGLILSIPALFGSTTRGVALYKKQFGSRRVAFGAVGKFSRHRCRIKDTFAADHFPGTARSFTGSRSINRFLDNTLRD